MKPKLRTGVLCVALACLPPAAQAYEFETHRTLSTIAAASSKLSDPAVLRGLGLRRPIYSLTQLFPSSAGGFWTVQDLIGEGAVLEDRPAIRVVNHFFDPTNDVDNSVLYTSPFWALEDTFGIAIGQKYSLYEGRKYQYKAYTETDWFTRLQNTGRFFETVGHVIHHVQDMGQPQHVRMDSHLNIADTLAYWGITTEMFFEHRSRYELYTENNLDYVSQFMTFGSAPALSRARDYWTNASGTGMADYTNRNFVSAGTNFALRYDGSVVAGARYANPVPTATATEVKPIRALFAAKGRPVPAQVDAACPAANDCSVLFFGTPASTRASSLSIFDEDLVANTRPVTYTNPDTFINYQVNRLFTLNEFNFDAALGLLLPRAIDYSTGLIDYIFRGKLEVSEPDDVVYAIVDPVQTQGFSKIKLKVRNTTPGEAMSGGKLTAVAKFHRNLCYRPDLSGEYPNVNILGCRSIFDEVAVSQESAAVNLPSGGAPFAISFDFGNTPIPVNATDLFIHIVYRGALGNESKAAAVGTIDLYEPTHIAYYNGTDIIEINDKYYTFQQIKDGIAAGDPTFAAVESQPPDREYHTPPDAYVIPQDYTNVPVSFRGPFQSPVATIPSFPNGRFVRLAVLTSRERLDFYPGVQNFRPWATGNQVSDDGTTFFVTEVLKFRGLWVQNGDIIFLCVYPTTCNGKLEDIPQSIVPEALVPLQMTVTQQFP